MRKNLYINQSGTLSRKDNTLLFENINIKKTIPIIGIENIYLLGETTINSKLLSYLSENKITCHFFNYYGYYTGSFYPKESYMSGKLFVKQVEHYTDNIKRLIIARKIVNGIAENLAYILTHYYKHGDLSSSIITSIKKSAQKLEYTETIFEILRVEGEIWEKFYSTFNHFLMAEFEFRNRVKRPPDNPINALISFGNSMLYSKVTSKIYHTQLNPTISYLHEPSDARFSLSLDIAELFKPSITFQTIFKLVNKRMLKLEHFNKDLNYCILNEEGRKIFVQEFEDKLSETFEHPKLKRKFSYDGMIKIELYKLTKHLMEEQEYEPYLISRGF
ncbi:MAG: type I-B CRISPR-associated endonuclease Cas1b [bacterium]